jgi:iron-sulfur cluster repair protein YtfE (RIC family)
MTTIERDGEAMIQSFVAHEHHELVAGIDHIHEVACELPTAPANQMSVKIGSVLRWVDTTLKPHMTWEDEWLFPQIDKRAQTPWATRLIRFDHRQICRQAERLSSHRMHLEHGPSTEAMVEIRGDLFALEALLRANLEREESFLMPLLESEANRWASEWQG